MRSDPSRGLNRVLSSPLRLNIAAFLFIFMCSALLCPFGSDEGSTPDREVFLKNLPGWAVELGTGRAWAGVVVPIDTPITDLTARAKTGLVQLVWSNQSGVMRYDVYRADEYSPSAFQKIGETNSAYSTWLDLGLENDVTYLYMVYAVYADQSLASQVVSAHPPSQRIITNYPPVFHTEPATSAIATQPYLYTAQATDPNADTVAYGLAVAPNGMTIDPGTGVIAWTPPGPSGGSYPVTVTASDGKGGAATQHFTITALDEPPTARIAGEAVRLVTVGDTVRLDGSGSTDPDGDPLSYQWSLCGSAGGLGAFSDPNAAITTFVPASPGDCTICLIVSDGQVSSPPAQIFVSAHPPPPEVTMSATPESILSGDWATLTWNATNADSCTIEPGIGTVGTSGSIAVSPGETTTYTIRASEWWPGWSAEATAQATVQVTYPAPTASLSANPATVQAGDSVTLTWSTANADSVSIEPAIGGVGESGSITVTPTLPTTTYILTASGRGGTANAIAAVTVIYPAPTASISANPASIVSGQSATLSWSTTTADTVTIDQGIGTVAANGSITVTPTQTTTYTITVTGPGGTKTSIAMVTVTHPVPTVTLSANPATVQAGESATLTWTTAHADSVTIDQGIGTVAGSGSTTVVPTQTTTYTITATGPGGTLTSTATVTVTHPAPTVTLSVDPANIQAGQSAVLSWISANADSVTIDQGIGSVAQNGSLAVSPSRTTTYAITATGAGGTATAGATLTVNAISLRITSPQDGEYISGPTVLVDGFVGIATGGEVGVSVNGIPACVDDGRFVVNRVPLADGENVITVTAKDAGGETLQASVRVNAQTTDDFVLLVADLGSGIAPFETILRIKGTVTLTDQSVAYSGPGTATFTHEADSDEYGIGIEESGVYKVSVTGLDLDGVSHTSAVSIVVWDESRLASLLKARWSEMRARLVQGDVQGALGYFHESSRESYNEIYSALSDTLPQIAAEMRDIDLADAFGKGAVFRIVRSESCGGELLDITYHVYFILDDDGLWKIYKY